MEYTFTVSDDFKVIVKQDDKKIDEVGPWADAEGATYWAGEMARKYDENPTYVYPKENPLDEFETAIS
jgi:hypothetical protein